MTPLVLGHLRVHPSGDFTPYELAKVLGRSHGAVRRVLLKLSTTATVKQTQLRPARFQIIA